MCNSCHEQVAEALSQRLMLTYDPPTDPSSKPAPREQAPCQVSPSAAITQYPCLQGPGKAG
jgi:hypothetical protein